LSDMDAPRRAVRSEAGPGRRRDRPGLFSGF
jgi:hypothetical protein